MKNKQKEWHHATKPLMLLTLVTLECTRMYAVEKVIWTEGIGFGKLFNLW